jgi:hypothetical protein
LSFIVGGKSLKLTKKGFEQEVVDDETWNKSLYIIDAHFDEFQKFLDYKYSIKFP